MMKRFLSLFMILVLCFSFATAMADDFSWLYEDDGADDEELPAPKWPVVTFGTWEQDNNTKNGAEPIQWYVINNEQKGKVMLLSVYALDAVPFQDKHVSKNWAASSLRTWMNKTFLSKAFTKAEQKMLVTTKVVNNAKHCAPDWPNNISGDCNDRAYLLSYAEVYKTYLKNQKSTQICEATPYAIAHGVQVLDTETNACFWWTRTTGNYRYMRIIVMDDGTYEQMDMETTSIGVRPVIWVNRKAVDSQLSLNNKK